MWAAKKADIITQKLIKLLRVATVSAETSGIEWCCCLSFQHGAIMSYGPFSELKIMIGTLREKHSDTFLACIHNSFVLEFVTFHVAVRMGIQCVGNIRRMSLKCGADATNSRTCDNILYVSCVTYVTEPTWTNYEKEPEIWYGLNFDSMSA